MRHKQRRIIQHYRQTQCTHDVGGSSLLISRQPLSQVHTLAATSLPLAEGQVIVVKGDLCLGGRNLVGLERHLVTDVEI